jgi:hypothetical protein
MKKCSLRVLCVLCGESLLQSSEFRKRLFQVRNDRLHQRKWLEISGLESISLFFCIGSSKMEKISNSSVLHKLFVFSGLQGIKNLAWNMQ